MPSSPPGQDIEVRVDALVKSARGAWGDFVAWRRTRLGLRGMLLYVLAGPLALASIVSLAQGELGAALAAGSAFGLIAGGGFLNRRGLLEELVTSERRYTRSRDLPHRYLGALAVAAGTSVGAIAAVGHDLWVGAAFGLLALAGFHLSYGLPPLRSVIAPKHPVVRDKPLQQALAQAEGRLLTIEKAALRIGNRELEQRLQRIAAQGRAILEQIVARPDERFRARKFLNVYLEGAEQVASRYARTHRLVRGQQLEDNFRNVLVEIETVFDRQLGRLAEHDVFDLDVQIEVLRKQLEREGIT